MTTEQPLQTPPTTLPCYYLGIDGGGSKTLAVVTDEHGNETGRGMAGSTNYGVVGATKAVQHIFEATSRALHGLHGHIHIKRAWLGLAGIDRPADIALLEPLLCNLAATVNITNDAELALSVLPDAIGVVLISGTGSISLGRNARNQATRAGGWGHILGDEGSGYALGLQALQAAVRAADGRDSQTRLLELILQQWNLNQPDDILGEVYLHDDKAKIARLSRLVFQAAQEGDSSAQQIVETGAHELALVVDTVCRKLDIPTTEEVPLALGGGLLLYEEQYRERFLTCLRQRRAVGTIIHIEDPALNAARTVRHLTDFNHWIRI